MASGGCVLLSFVGAFSLLDPPSFPDAPPQALAALSSFACLDALCEGGSLLPLIGTWEKAGGGGASAVGAGFAKVEEVRRCFGLRVSCILLCHHASLIVYASAPPSPSVQSLFTAWALLLELLLLLPVDHQAWPRVAMEASFEFV